MSEFQILLLNILNYHNDPKILDRQVGQTVGIQFRLISVFTVSYSVRIIKRYQPLVCGCPNILLVVVNVMNDY